MENQYRRDIITCYESVWELYNEIPTLTLLYEAYKELEHDNVHTYAVGFYSGIGCYDEADRIYKKGISDDDYDKIGFDKDSCITDIDIVLEDSGHVYKRDNGEVVNSSSIYLFSEE